jgi:chromodomain-helicase-DNA-binding protein 1
MSMSLSLHPCLYLVIQKQLKLSGEDMPRDDKVAILKDSLAAIGRRIELVLSAKQAAGEDCERWRRHLWT